ncbi:unnamed protein product [Rotaria magnacalcarata]|uniref:Uncharacterized protein n=1 Tax=Rotaria magnacalcarata TaxID=392030 RepID=A0A816L2P7_9BILA|nr:unnamed protein product [Rotaria magnacalcarata]
MLIVLKVSLETFIQTDDIDYNLDDLFDEKKEKDTPPHHDSETMIPELEALLKENDESVELNMSDLCFTNDTIPFSDVADNSHTIYRTISNIWKQISVNEFH